MPPASFDATQAGMRANCDVIGVNYSKLRKSDPRIAAAISSVLGSAATVPNVGAGTGSPIATRIRLRPLGEGGNVRMWTDRFYRAPRDCLSRAMTAVMAAKYVANWK